MFPFQTQGKFYGESKLKERGSCEGQVRAGVVRKADRKKQGREASSGY